MLVPIVAIVIGLGIPLAAFGKHLLATAKRNDGPGKIGTTTLSKDWQAIDASGTPRDIRFDAIAELAWVKGIAAEWNPNAAFTTLHANEVGKDGIVSLSESAWVEYWFEAPWISHGPANELTIMVDAKSGQPRVRVGEYKDMNWHQVLEAVCTMHDALAALAKTGRPPEQILRRLAGRQEPQSESVGATMGFQIAVARVRRLGRRNIVRCRPSVEQLSNKSVNRNLMSPTPHRLSAQAVAKRYLLWSRYATSRAKRTSDSMSARPMSISVWIFGVALGLRATPSSADPAARP